MHDYTVYLSKNDLPLAFGTARECAKALNLTLGSFWSMVSRTRTGENKKYIVCIEEGAHDET